MTRRFALVLAAALGLSLAACDAGGPDPVGLTGRWEGTLTNLQDPTQRYAIQLLLTDTGDRVTGTGEVRLPRDLLPFRVVNGSFVTNLVSLSLRFERPPFEGSLSGILTGTNPGEITGTFSGSGLANGPVVVELVARRVR